MCVCGESALQEVEYSCLITEIAKGEREREESESRGVGGLRGH